MLLAFIAFFAITSFAKTGDIKIVEPKVEKQETVVSDIKATEQNVATNTANAQNLKFPLSIQASCGTFTFQYTCPGCTWSQIQNDIAILELWSELTCMVFY